MTTSGNHQNIYQSTPPVMSSANSSNTATMRRQNLPPNSQQKHHDTVESIPSSNSIDSAMYERDKQIYKCSTLRQGGKFDPKYKPSILNCPLPEIPKDADSPKKESVKEPNTSYCKTLQRPPMKLPPPGKAIPPPKIDTPTSPPQGGEKNTTQNQGGTNSQLKSPSPPVQSPKNSDSNKSVEVTEQSTINPNDESNYAVTEL